MRALGDLLLAALAVVVLGSLGISLNNLDASSEWRQSDVLSEQQQQRDRDTRRDMAAARQCREQHGEASFTWTQDNRLVCIPRRGKAVVWDLQP